MVNYHNLHIWAHENPHAIRSHDFQHEFSFGLIENTLCGSYILPDRLNSQLFYDFLQNYLFELLLMMYLSSKARDVDPAGWSGSPLRKNNSTEIIHNVG